MKGMTRKLIVSIAATATLVGGLVAAPAGAAAGCAGNGAGGDWSRYGLDLSNSRNQTAEKTIDPSNAASLSPAWTVQTDGSFQSTPTEAFGCVFAGTSGAIYAWNADTGKLVWKADLAKEQITGDIFAVPVVGGRVYAAVSGPKGPFAIALDRRTGKLLWQTPVLSHTKGAWTNASAVVYKGMVFVGTSGLEAEPKARGNFAILDARTGRVLLKRWLISDHDFKHGRGGGGIWSTSVIDPATGYLYAGGGNPYGKQRDTRWTNAILKIDIDRNRPTFGDVVSAYKAVPDQYVAAGQILTDSPACPLAPGTFLTDYTACGQLDLDFGASPNLFRNSKGELLVGDLQKAGIYHAAYADTMEGAWSTVVGPPCELCNAATAAVDANSVYVAGSPGSVMYALDKDTGAYRWETPIADGTHYEAVTVANGVVYALDTTSQLDMFDAKSGQLLMSRPLLVDTASSGGSCSNLGASVAVARHHVYAACSGWIIAYGLSNAGLPMTGASGPVPDRTN
jgi:polyvinyl alcohol dehydrogenase (cytochrome)